MTRSIAIALAASTLLVTGCTDDYTIEFRYISSAPPEVLVDADQIRLPEGIAVGVEAIAVEDDRLVGSVIDFVPVRPGIIGIDRRTHERTYVFYGISVGATSVDYYFDAELIGTIPAEVVPQQPQP